jgi:hypothetical protein
MRFHPVYFIACFPAAPVANEDRAAGREHRQRLRIAAQLICALYTVDADDFSDEHMALFCSRFIQQYFEYLMDKILSGYVHHFPMIEYFQ